MFCILWKYRVRSECLPEFENMYSSSGSWALLFRKYEGFLSTELLRSDDEYHFYLTIDRWSSEDHYEAFLQKSRTEYEFLDKQGEKYTEEEELIGRFFTC